MAKFSREEILRLPDLVVPGSIYAEEDRLIPVIEEAVNRIMHYDGFASMSVTLAINDPTEIKKNISNADMVTLMVFLKFLTTKIEEGEEAPILTAMREYVIAFLQQALESRETEEETPQE